jgi:hypothetical protein
MTRKAREIVFGNKRVYLFRHVIADGRLEVLVQPRSRRVRLREGKSLTEKDGDIAMIFKSHDGLKDFMSVFGITLKEKVHD